MDRFVAVDTETTGLTPRRNDIIEIAVVVLDHNGERDRSIIPFHTYMSPLRPQYVDLEAIKVHPELRGSDKVMTIKKYQEFVCNGLDPLKVPDLLFEWVERLNLPPKSRLIPIGHNYACDKEFIHDLLGDSMYSYIFSHNHICTRVISTFVNDCYAFACKPRPFDKSYRLKDVCNVLGVELLNAHTALDDAIATAEVYKRLKRYVQTY